MKKSSGTIVAIMAVVILAGTFITAKCATAGETGRDGRFIAYDNGTVLDNGTNLMWAAHDSGSNINRDDAKSYCEHYRGGGYTDWRMPTGNELAALYDTGKIYMSNCGNPVYLTALIHLTCSSIWASEARDSDAATFYFDFGKLYWAPQSQTINYRALPVRSGK